MANSGLPALNMPQFPNIAARQLTAAQTQQATNMAALAREKQAAIQRKQYIDTADFSLNVLSGVNSEEDLQIAKRQIIARFPEEADDLERLIPSYSPRAIEMIRNSLRDETQRLKLEEKDLKGFAAGTSVYRDGKKIEQVPPTPAKEPKHEVFESKAGDQIWVRPGEAIPPGYRKVRGAGGITIQTGVGDLGKVVRNKLEGDIIEATHNIRSFQTTRKLFKPEYLTYMGKGEKLSAELMDKAGISTKGQRKLIHKRSKWFRQAKADFIAYRKWATGVAGGPKELAEIATAFPDPVNNSPEQYQANLDGIEETTKKVLMLNADFLRSGINLDQPLDRILAEARGIGIGAPAGAPAAPATPAGGGQTVLRFDKQGNLIQ